VALTQVGAEKENAAEVSSQTAQLTCKVLPTEYVPRILRLWFHGHELQAKKGVPATRIGLENPFFRAEHAREAVWRWGDVAQRIHMRATDTRYYAPCVKKQNRGKRIGKEGHMIGVEYSDFHNMTASSSADIDRTRWWAGGSVSCLA
jgi:hypothetical protein